MDTATITKEKRKQVKRGEIYLASLNNTGGHVQSGIRPVLIVQNDKGNVSSNTVIAVPLTTKIKAYLPTHLFIPKKYGLAYDSTLLTEQIQTIDKNNLMNYICSLNDNIMMDISYKMMISLGIV